ETMVTSRAQAGKPQVSVTENPNGTILPALEQIRAAHAALAQLGLGVGFFPVWELRTGASSILYLAPMGGTTPGSLAAGRLSLAGMPESKTHELEIELLKTAAAYAAR